MTQEEDRGGANFLTGAICTDSNLYKCSDDVFEIIEYVEAGTAFPNGGFGTGKGKTSWKKITLATDGSRTTLDGSKFTG